MDEFAEIVLSPEQSEGSTHQVGQWLKRAGDLVKRDEPLLEIITDKVTVEIAAPAQGRLSEILKQEGESIEPGEVLGRISTTALVPGRTAEFTAPKKAEPVPSEPPHRRTAELAELAPAVRRVIQEKGLDPAQIRGTGRGGRITLQDVEAAGLTPGQTATPPHRMVPHSPMRKSIAEHMVKSVQAAPHVTAVFEADLTRVIAHRNTHQEHHVTYTAYFVRASVAALQAVPEANSRWHEQGLELFDDCNIGIAVALEGGGLIVPVLQRAQDLDLLATARKLDDLTARARAGKLDPRDVQGGTFTISNHGVSGSLFAAPVVINQPQVAVLGIGKLEQRPRVRADGAIEARPMAYVTLTIDHRALDGYQANRFLSKWVEAIEQWS